MLSIAKGGSFSIELLEECHGFICFRVKGKTALKDFKNEGGGHRFQRVSPTERKGRVHTSTITVAVLPEVSEVELKINPEDLEWKATRGSGAGGQHRNVTDSAVILTHLPSKMKIRCESERSQHQNKEIALDILRARLQSIATENATSAYNSERKNQVGSGQRGDKIRTIRLQDDVVVDHQTNKKMSAKLYLKGHIDLLY